MIDLVALALVALLAYLGWRRGTILTALSGGSLLVGYLGAVLLYRPLGQLLRGVFSVPSILAFPLGGMVAVLTISLLLRVVAARLKIRRLRRLDKGWTPSTVDRTGGAMLGAVWATAIVVFLAWAAIVVRGLTGQGPDVEKTLAGQLTSAVVGRVAYILAERLTGDEVLASTISLAAVKPSEAAETVSRLVGDPGLRALFEDRALRAAVMRSDFASVTGHPAIRDLARDPRFLDAAERVRLVGDLSSNATQSEVTEQLVERIAPMVRTAETLSRDGAVQQILRNPRFLEKLQGGDIGALATDPEFNQLAEKFVESFNAGRLGRSRR